MFRIENEKKVESIENEKIDVAKREVTIIGFFLPIGISNFVHAVNDQPLLELVTDINKSDGNLDFRISSALNYAKNNFDSIEENPLNTSIYRRLLTVLAEFGYEYAIPYYPDFRLDYLEIVEDTDPDSAIFITKLFPVNDVNQIILSVSDDGYYQWFFFHEPQNEYSSFVSNLKKHIYELVDNLTIYKSFPEHSNNQLLDELEKNYTGILVFFQLNLLLEGLYNSIFNPRIFFLADQSNLSTGQVDSLHKNILNLENEQYSLINILKEIVAYCDIANTEEKIEELIHICRSVENLKSSQYEEQKESRKKLKLLVTKYHNHEMRRDLLRQFLRKTSSTSLKILKWNLEDCRRELLPYTITFTDFQQRLVQLHSPDGRSMEFDGANESQLSGYVKFISAKFPIIMNVNRYVKLAHDDLPNKEKTEIKKNYDDWVGRIKSIANNIEALERTLDRVNDERQLSELSQSRREIETQAEISRRRQRLGFSEGASGSKPTELPSFLDISLIFIGAISAIFTITYGISQPFVIKPWAVNIILPFLLLYIVLVLARIIGSRLVQQSQISKNRFYHELDLVLELPIDSDGAATLFERGFEKTIFEIPRDQIVIPSKLVGESDDELITINDSAGEKVSEYLKTAFPRLPRFQQPQQVAYRYSHGNFNEGTHKVHYEFDIHWPHETETLSDSDRGLGEIIFPYRHNIMENCELIYEVLSHSPSNKMNHMLQEMRFIATYNKKLTPEQIMYLKIKLVNNFVLRWLPEELQPMKPKIYENILPLFSLTIAVLVPNKVSENKKKE